MTLRGRIKKKPSPEATGGWGKLHSEKIHDLGSEPRVRKPESRRMNWTEHVARIGEKRYAYLWESQRKETSRKIKK
jgi:hypothetical protein